MSQKCDNRNPLLRDGTSQAQRVLKALLPEYIAVDERKMEDLIAFAKNVATEIKYFDLTNVNPSSQNWVGFFTKTLTDDQRNEPHYTLFIAFLEMFRVAQNDLNTITKRHLDFYYREVLHMNERAAVPDQVFIIFDLVDEVTKSLVKKDTDLDAAQDGLGNDLRYTVDKDIVVNQAKVESLKAVFSNNRVIAAGDPLPYNHHRIYASGVANSADGNGAEIEGDEKSWKIFGKPSQLLTIPSPGNTGRSQADIGFAIASPVLFLAEGKRKITISVNFNSVYNLNSFAHFTAQANVTFSNNVLQSRALPLSNSPARIALPQSAPLTPAQTTAVQNILSQCFKVYFSGEEEWILPEADASDRITISGSEITIVRTLAAGQKPVVAYNSEALGQPFETQWPVVKLVLNTEAGVNPWFYEQFKERKAVSAKVEVDVSEIKGVVLQNDEAILKADQPFYPFGNRPSLGSTFYVGSTEIFQKNLSSLSCEINWHGLPQEATTAGFGAYYTGYSPDNINNNTDFKVEAHILHKRNWVSLGTHNLFTGNPGVEPDRTITLTGNALKNIARDPAMLPVEEFGPAVKKGFLRLSLTNVDFGHHTFQNSFATAAIAEAKRTSGSAVPLPKEPYTPQIKDIVLSYKSSAVVNIQQSPAQRTQSAYDNRIDQYFHVMPFGVAEQHPYVSLQVAPVDFLPQYDEEGALYIGLSNVAAPAVLNIMFKVSEGSADPDLNRQPVKWSFMVKNQWVDFNPRQILSDSTNGLLTSGIISFEIPKAITGNNTAFSSTHFWLRATVEKDSSAVCDLLDVQAQAVTATFSNRNNDPKHLDKALTASTIADFVNSDANIEEVKQPYASFNGKPVEDSTSFYTRVSERLRHKNRAITIKDHELLVLEKFQTIYKVKCLNHTDYVSLGNINERKPGYVSVVVISKLRNKNAVNLLQPKTSLVTMTEIGEYLKQLHPPCAELRVRNPIYEEVEMDFSVRFLPGYDSGFYAAQLDRDIREFLAPWAFDSGRDIVFGGKLHKTVVLNFVEERPYVDYLTCFNMNQYIPSPAGTVVNNNIDEAVATTSASVLTSYASHKIHVLETDDCECESNDVTEPYMAPPTIQDCECGTVQQTDIGPDGIGADEILNDFIVGHTPAGTDPIGNLPGSGTASNDGIGFWGIENDFDIQ